jgi:hypothetical protein
VLQRVLSQKSPTNELIEDICEPVIYLAGDMTDSELKELVKGYNFCQSSLTQMLNQEITPDEYLDRLEAYGVVMDNYLDCCEEVAEQEGFL